jgi:para-aminobenzoate synthetase component 1
MILPVLERIRTGWREPVEVLSAFADEPWTLGLFSDGSNESARWSYLLREPDRALSVAGDDPVDPFAALAALLGPLAPADAAGPPFQGGVAGLCAYELGDRVEPLGLARKPGWPDLACARYPALLAFDHHERAVWALGRGDDRPAARGQAARALAWLTTPATRVGGKLVGELVPEPPDAYEAAVHKVVGRIQAGEIFQANIARAWRGRLEPGQRPAALMDRLAGASPAPFGAYLRLADRAVVSNSPERFISVTRAGASFVAEARPIKGTRLRGSDALDDARQAEALRGSAKDRAENLMIVDLMRNDLARVCQAGAVETPDLFRVESFANVHHLVSTVRGRLAPGRTAIDLLRAAFPPGSITGAPKIQAMKVIAELEVLGRL